MAARPGGSKGCDVGDGSQWQGAGRSFPKGHTGGEISEGGSASAGTGAG